MLHEAIARVAKQVNNKAIFFIMMFFCLLYMYLFRLQSYIKKDVVCNFFFIINKKDVYLHPN